MNKMVGAQPAVVPAAGLLSLMTPELDELGHEELRASAFRDIRECGFSPAIAERLDAVFTLKVVRLLRAAHASQSDFQAADALIAAIARDRFKQALDEMPERFYARWKALRDALALAQKLQEYAASVSEHVNDAGASAWEIVAEMVVKAGTAGIAWARIAEVLGATEAGPRSKSGVSQLLTSMQSKGWIESVSRGRTKTLFAGRSIHLSHAWKKVHGEHAADVVAEPIVPSLVVTGRDSAIADTARRIVCLNQGSVLEFAYLAYERHRRLKHALNDLRKASAAKRAHKRDALAASVEDLVDFLRTRFKDVARQNFGLLREHFSGRDASVVPRFCIKGGWNSIVDDPLSIASIVRDNEGDNEDEVHSKDANTGFKRVVETGKFYLNNDIATDAIRKLYRNPRLSETALDRLRQQIDLEDLMAGRGLTADSWLNCWLDRDRDVNPRRFYRSTVIVPMTLQNNNLSNEFISLLGERVASFRGNGYDRAILGFLCLDHPQAGYFQRSLDVEVGYIVADLLSMCLFVSVAFTTLSQSYRAAIREVSQNSDEKLNEYVWRLSRGGPPSNQVTARTPTTLDLRESNKNLVLNMAASVLVARGSSSMKLTNAKPNELDHVFTGMVDGVPHVGGGATAIAVGSSRPQRAHAQRAVR